MPLEYDCPVCANRARLYDVVDFNKSCEESNGLFLPLSGTPVYYALCSHCGFLFAPEFQDWSREDFLTKIYNDDYIVVDPDFEKKRPEESAAMLHKLFGDHKKKFRHLDFGGGDGEMSRRLRERGWDSQSWDPFFDPASSLNGEKFDLITSIEVFEHAPDVHGLMEKLTSACHDSTFIYFSTFTHDQSIRKNGRIDWWYISPRNGHVSIFSKYSLGFLGDKYGFKFGSFTDYLHCYCKTVPAWAEHLMV